MVRLAVRKAPSKVTSRYSAKRTTAIKSPKKKSASKKTAATQKKAPNHQLFAPKLKNLMSKLNQYKRQRKQNKGSNDPVAKKLSNIHSTLEQELKKENVINEKTAKTLKNIPPALRGIPNAPKSINIQQLTKFIREHVKTDVIKFLNQMKSQMSPIQTELKRLEMQLNRKVKEAKNKKVQLKADPALKRRFSTLSNNIAKKKTNWFKLLNNLNRHADKNVKNNVNQLKKQFDELQKSVKRNLAILNRYSKAAQAKKGTKIEPILTAAQTKTCELKFNNIKKELEKFKKHIDCYLAQLKAVKTL